MKKKTKQAPPYLVIIDAKEKAPGFLITYLSPEDYLQDVVESKRNSLTFFQLFDIVKALNCHDELVEALDSVMNLFGSKKTSEVVITALADLWLRESNEKITGYEKRQLDIENIQKAVMELYQPTTGEGLNYGSRKIIRDAKSTLSKAKK